MTYCKWAESPRAAEDSTGPNTETNPEHPEELRAKYFFPLVLWYRLPHCTFDQTIFVGSRIEPELHSGGGFSHYGLAALQCWRILILFQCIYGGCTKRLRP